MNPRKMLGDLAELVTSIKAKGVLQPILARALPTGHVGDVDYEIVFGHRRAAAAEKAGLSSIPAMVREMTDREVLEAQLIENCQRADMQPLEEADGFKALHETHGCSVDELAAKIGKSAGYVYGRLKLCSLVAAAREKLVDGTFSVAVALLVARLPRVEQQREAVEKLVAEASYLSHAGAKISLEAAEDALEAFHLELSSAPFPLELADLVDGAGACGPCPKRSSNQPVLFKELSQADVCTDVHCFADKRKAWLARQKTEAEAKGLTVLKASEARKALGYGSPLVQLDAVVSDGSKDKSIRALVGKKHGLKVQLAPTDEGKLVEVVERKAVNEALKKAGSKARVPTPTTSTVQAGGNEKWREQQERERQKRDAEEKLQAALLDKVLEEIETIEFSDKLWRFLALSSTTFIEQEVAERFFGKDLNIYRDKKKVPAAIAKLSIGKVRAFVIAANLSAGSIDETFALAELLGIDRKAVAAELKAAEKAAAAEIKEQGECAIPGCGLPIKRAGFCASHGSTLSGTEQKSILERNKRLVAEGKLPGRVKKLAGKAGADAR
jgi:ParB/RepB/Spo0J family partition protein